MPYQLRDKTARPVRYFEEEVSPPPEVARFTHRTVPYNPNLPKAAFPTLDLRTPSPKPARASEHTSEQLSEATGSIETQLGNINVSEPKVKKAVVFRSNIPPPPKRKAGKAAMLNDDSEPEMVFEDWLGETPKDPMEPGEFVQDEDWWDKPERVQLPVYANRMVFNELPDNMQFILFNEVQKLGEYYQDNAEGILNMEPDDIDHVLELCLAETARIDAEEAAINAAMNRELQRQMNGGVSSYNEEPGEYSERIFRDVPRTQPIDGLVSRNDIKLAKKYIKYIGPPALWDMLAEAVNSYEGISTSNYDRDHLPVTKDELMEMRKQSGQVSAPPAAQPGLFAGADPEDVDMLDTVPFEDDDNADSDFTVPKTSRRKTANMNQGDMEVNTQMPPPKRPRPVNKISGSRRPTKPRPSKRGSNRRSNNATTTSETGAMLTAVNQPQKKRVYQRKGTTATEAEYMSTPVNQQSYNMQSVARPSSIRSSGTEIDISQLRVPPVNSPHYEASARRQMIGSDQPSSAIMMTNQILRDGQNAYLQLQSGTNNMLASAPRATPDLSTLGYTQKDLAEIARVQKNIDEKSRMQQQQYGGGSAVASSGAVARGAARQQPPSILPPGYTRSSNKASGHASSSPSAVNPKSPRRTRSGSSLRGQNTQSSTPGSTLAISTQQNLEQLERRVSPRKKKATRKAQESLDLDA